MLERLAFVGYTAKSVVYTLVGVLAIAAAFGRSNKSFDQRGAVVFVLHQPFGRTLLGVLALGLAAYALFRVIGGVFDAEARERDMRAVAIRAGSVIRGLVYGGFAYEVLKLALRNDSGPAGSEQKTRHWTARAMDEPFGRWLVAIAGACIIGYGVYQLYRGVRGKLSKAIPIGKLPPSVVMISRVGMAARGAIFLVIGGSIIEAAIRFNPGAAHGMSGALRELAAKPFGSVLLILAGIGFIAYGVYAFIKGRYRRLAHNL